jgi:acetate kinase
VDNILVLNSGSQSEKIAVFTQDDGEKLTLVYRETRPHIAADRSEIKATRGNRRLNQPKARVAAEQFDLVGHRIVHGGSQFQHSMLASQDVLTGLKQLNQLAPLHNPPAHSRSGSQPYALPSRLNKYWCLTLPFIAPWIKLTICIALPLEWQEYSIRKYGFHGTSHQVLQPGTVAQQLRQRP